MAIFQTPNTSAVLRAAPRYRAGVASAFIAEARNVGMALGIALTAGIVTAALGPAAAVLDQTAHLTAGISDSLVAGMSTSMRVAVALALVAAALSWFFRGDEHPDA
jgi:hypothetical protein